jgi:predicted MFS family arabinose efflux permease
MAVLFSNGVLYATWGVSMPILKEKFGISEAILAVAMAAVALGGILTMAQAGRWIARVGSGTASTRSGLLMAVSAAPVLIVPSYYALLPLLLVYGIATAANDVAANSQGAHLERQARRSMIGSLHASFSAGGLLGALLASAWVTSGLPISSNFWLLAVLTAVVMLICARHLRNEPQVSSSLAESPEPHTIEQYPRAQFRLRFFGALAFCALVVEGAFYDWAAIYMREVVKAPASWVGFGYAAFAVGMCIGRLSGDRVRDAVPHQAVATMSGAICIAGVAVILTVDVPAIVVAGFWMAGIGLSNFIPMLFSSAGRLSQNVGLPPSQGLASTTRMAYVGLLAGPLLIGPIAQQIGLRNSLITLTLAVAATSVGWLYISHVSSGVPWDIQPRSRRTHGAH